MLAGFALAACSSEARLLSRTDVIEVEQGLEFQLWRPKVNKDDAHGVPYGTCPVRALRAWRQCLIDRGCQPTAR
ncbi:integrase, partial [Streptomyces sp. NPDC056304]